MSRFVAAGSGGSDYMPPATTATTDEWTQAQEDLEATRRAKDRAAAGQQEGKSLYEVLQANKAAKQEEFEEKAKLKNQFRALDDDEVDFLDSVLETERSKEAEVRKETAEQLNAFRKLQDEALKAAAGNGGDGENDDAGGRDEVISWTSGASRKRKKGQEAKEGLKGVKVRRTSSSAAHDGKETRGTALATSTQEVAAKGPEAVTKPSNAPPPAAVSQVPTQSSSTAPTTSAPGLGLAGYSSDED